MKENICPVISLKIFVGGVLRMRKESSSQCRPLSTAPWDLDRAFRGTQLIFLRVHRRHVLFIVCLLSTKFMRKQKEVSKLLTDGKHLEHWYGTKTQSERNITCLGQHRPLSSTWNRSISKLSTETHRLRTQNYRGLEMKVRLAWQRGPQQPSPIWCLSFALVFPVQAVFEELAYFSPSLVQISWYCHLLVKWRLFKCSWALNNAGLNCVGLLVSGFFQLT